LLRHLVHQAVQKYSFLFTHQKNSSGKISLSSIATASRLSIGGPMSSSRQLRSPNCPELNICSKSTLSKKSPNLLSSLKTKFSSPQAKSRNSKPTSKSQSSSLSARPNNSSIKPPGSLPPSTLRFYSAPLKRSKIAIKLSGPVELSKMIAQSLKKAAAKATCASQSCLLLTTRFPQCSAVLTWKSQSEMQRQWRTS
jgi:hypothetical protein